MCKLKCTEKRFIPFTSLHFLPEFVPHTEFKGRPEDTKWNVLNHTSFRNYAPFSLQVPSILSILLGKTPAEYGLQYKYTSTSMGAYVGVDNSKCIDSLLLSVVILVTKLFDKCIVLCRSYSIFFDKFIALKINVSDCDSDSPTLSLLPPPLPLKILVLCPMF